MESIDAIVAANLVQATMNANELQDHPAPPFEPGDFVSQLFLSRRGFNQTPCKTLPEYFASFPAM